VASQKRGADSAGYGGTPVQQLLEPNGGFFTRNQALPSSAVRLFGYAIEKTVAFVKHNPHFQRVLEA
jgi:hypothetical protein